MRKSDERLADVYFIRERYDQLAAMAWKGYRDAGRGFLLITVGATDAFPQTKDILDMKGNPFAGTTRAVYVPLKALKACGADYPDENLEEMLDRYDAEREIVLAIERVEGGGWGSYRYVCPEKPSIIYRQMKEYVN